jgi:two-component system, LytTR family, response regulator
MKMKCIIVDDEPLARKLLKEYCSKVPFVEVVGDFYDGLSALSFLRNNPIDFMFLDIKMPDISGIELAKIVDKKAKIIFTTAFAEHAVDGFELDAVDYLLKPFDFPRFLKAVNKVSDITSEKEVKDKSTVETNDFLFVKDGRELVKVFYNDIRYIKGMKDYVVFQEANKKVMSLMTMKDLERDLPSKKFIRLHQSYIINTQQIASISNDKVKIGEEFIPISQTYKQAFKLFLESHIG